MSTKQTEFEKIQDPDLYAEIKANWEAVNNVEGDQRKAANEDARFAHIEGEQWSDQGKKERADKPMYEINRVVGSINVVVGEQRKNSISMKTIPLGSGATKDIATTLNGLTRNIQNRSHFDNIQADAFKEIATGGYGAWRLTTGYANDESANQDISIKGIRDAANSVFFDNGSVEDNHRDANWCFVLADIPVAQFKKEYPEASPVDVESNTKNYQEGWCNTANNTVRVADYYRKESEEVEAVFLFKDGVTKKYEVTEGYESVKDELEGEGFQEIRRRMIKKFTIVHYKISGAQILKGKQKWDGKFIPVIMSYGYIIWIDGIRYVRGLVRMSKGSQRLYNYSRSAIVEAQALAKSDPLWITSDQASGNNDLGKNLPIQVWKFVAGQPQPFRTGTAGMQSALIEISNQAAADVKATTGLPDQSLGEDPSVRSGIAIQELKAQGSVGSFELQDNLTKAVEYTNEQIIDLLPRVIDTERQEMILNPDGNEELVYINKEIIDKKTGKPTILNDLSLGTYGVVSSNGANYKTKRIETLNTVLAIRAEDENVRNLTSDILLENLDDPIGGILGKRVRKDMVKRGVVEPTEEELEEAQKNAPQEPSPAEVAQENLLKFEVEKKAVEVDNMELEGEQLRANIEKINAEIETQKATTAKTYADTNKSFADANKNSTRETPSEVEAQEKAADAANTIIEETFETEAPEIIENQQELFNENPIQETEQPLNDNNLLNQEI